MLELYHISVFERLVYFDFAKEFLLGPGLGERRLGDDFGCIQLLGFCTL